MTPLQHLPTSQVPDPANAPPIRWGILATMQTMRQAIGQVTR